MESIAAQTLIELQHPKAQAKVVFLPEVIDKLIVEEVESLTKADNKFWSSPEHDRSAYLHCFFQYPAMMVPIVQRRLIEIILKYNPSINNVIDPYMGSGTSLVTCMENGLNCFGQDINPLAFLVTNTRTGPYQISAIKNRKGELFESIIKDQLNNIEVDFKGRDKWFKPEVSIELSKIVRAIRKEKNKIIRKFYWVILAEVVRLTSNDRTSTFKLHQRPIQEIANRNISPIQVFQEHFTDCFEDLIWHCDLLTKSNKLSRNKYPADVNLHLLDSKTKIWAPTNEGGFYDLLVTSPPYGDNKTTVTYGQHSYLQLQWIDLEDIDECATPDFLKSTSEIDSRGLGGRLKNIGDEDLEILFLSSPSFKRLYEKLQATAPDMVKKVVSFIHDLYLSLVNIHTSLKPNAYQIWTIGNRNVGGIEVKNNKILEELITNQGSVLVTSIKREILNKRMAKRNKDASLMNYEDILIFRKIA